MDFMEKKQGGHHTENEYVWVVDPLDSTVNFILHIPLYSVSIALVRRGSIHLGVISIPSTQELFHAERGNGAYCNGKIIHVSQTNALEKAVCSVGF